MRKMPTTIGEWVTFCELNYGKGSAPVKWLHDQAEQFEDGMDTLTDPEEEQGWVRKFKSMAYGF